MCLNLDNQREKYYTKLTSHVQLNLLENKVSISKKNDEQVSITKRWELDGLPKITPKKSTKNGKKNLSK